MSELKEILQNVLEDIDKDSALVDCLEEQINRWHIRERKKWVMRLLQTIIEEGDCLPDGIALEIVTQIRKKIEES